MPFAVPLTLNSHLSPTLLPGELRTKRLTAVVQTDTARVTVWLRETSEHVHRGLDARGGKKIYEQAHTHTRDNHSNDNNEIIRSAEAHIYV